jgi:hypothetical protein
LATASASPRGAGWCTLNMRWRVQACVGCFRRSSGLPRGIPLGSDFVSRPHSPASRGPGRKGQVSLSPPSHLCHDVSRARRPSPRRRVPDRSVETSGAAAARGRRGRCGSFLDHVRRTRGAPALFAGARGRGRDRAARRRDRVAPRVQRRLLGARSSAHSALARAAPARDGHDAVARTTGPHSRRSRAAAGGRAP